MVNSMIGYYTVLRESWSFLYLTIIVQLELFYVCVRLKNLPDHLI